MEAFHKNRRPDPSHLVLWNLTMTKMRKKKIAWLLDTRQHANV